MTSELAVRNGATGMSLSQAIEQVLIGGDLMPLKPEQRVEYYHKVCESLGLNPYTRPFLYLMLNGKLVLYATRDCGDQLRALHHVSVSIVGRERLEDVYVVTARATLPNGRTDESTGAVAIGALKGDYLANSLMKAETKSKRRVTLSIVGLGFLDETEIDSIRDAQRSDLQDYPRNPDSADPLLAKAVDLAEQAAPEGTVDVETVESPAPSAAMLATEFGVRMRALEDGDAAGFGAIVADANKAKREGRFNAAEWRELGETLALVKAEKHIP